MLQVKRVKLNNYHGINQGKNGREIYPVLFWYLPLQFAAKAIIRDHIRATHFTAQPHSLHWHVGNHRLELLKLTLRD